MAIERIGLTTEYKADGLGETKPVLRIGGKTEKFVPNVNASFSCETGTEKYWYNINANSVIVDKQTEILASDSVSLKVGDTTEQYVVEKYYGQECLKWKRIFDKHPATNVFEYKLDFGEKVSFYRQPSLKELQAEYPDDGRDEGFEMEHYAVYCDRKDRVVDENGKTIENYSTGKLGFILPPMFTDANGNKLQGRIEIDGNVLRTTIDKAWFEKAVFPVIANDTFGYTTGGASYTGCDRNYIYCAGPYSPAGNGTLTSITLPKLRIDANTNFTLGIYDDSGGYPNLLKAQSAGALETSGNPTSIDQDVSLAITASTPYWLAFNKDDANAVRYYYDAGTGNLSSQSQTYSGGNLTTDLSISSYNFTSRDYSIYGTYTAAGGASSTPSSTLARGIAVGMFKGMGIGSGQYP